MANCPVCSDILLRHIRSGQTYWFCRRCRVEILEEPQTDKFLDRPDLASLPVEETAATPDFLKQPIS